MVELIDSSNTFKPLVASKQPMYFISSSEGLTFKKKFINFKNNNKQTKIQEAEPYTRVTKG
jgi:hypothetical protein